MDKEDAAPARSDPLLRPLTLKKLTLRNRIISTSHACGLEVGGMPKEAYQRYHEEKARGGIALSMFGGSSNVDRDSPNIFHQLNVGDDAIIPHLQEFSARMHAQGAALMCQITHLGRRGDPYGGDWLPTIGPSPLRETLHRSIPREMDRYDVERVVNAYARAALRCREGGLDGIETLAGGHLIGQFLSPATNRRTDEFGGSLEGRIRFALMVHEAIRKAVGDDFLVGIRFVVDEGTDDGLRFEECVRAALILKRAGVVDFFNAIYGTMDTVRALAEENMPGMGSPLAPWVKPVAAFRSEVGLPVLHAARIADIASARFAVADEALRHLSSVASSHLRNMDALSRFGGDEFMLLLPHASVVDAERVCMRLRNNLRRSPLRLEDGTMLMISVSCGIAATENADTFPDLSKRADTALYDAKYAGRGTHRTAPADCTQRRASVG